MTRATPASTASDTAGLSGPQDLARALLAAREAPTGGRLVPISKVPALSMQDAYEVQRHVARATGAIGAFKVARKPDQPSILAPIFTKDIVDAPAHFPARTFSRIGVELELAFRVISPLPDPADADFASRARDCLSLLPVIEVVDSRLDDLDAPATLKLADNQLNGALVLGPDLRDWQQISTTSADAFLRFDDQVILDGPTPVPGQDAYDSFCELARIVTPVHGALQVGQIVITGSLNGLPYVPAGTAVEGRIAGLGEVSVKFD